MSSGNLLRLSELPIATFNKRASHMCPLADWGVWRAGAEMCTELLNMAVSAAPRGHGWGLHFLWRLGQIKATHYRSFIIIQYKYHGYSIFTKRRQHQKTAQLLRKNTFLHCSQTFKPTTPNIPVPQTGTCSFINPKPDLNNWKKAKII